MLRSDAFKKKFQLNKPQPAFASDAAEPFSARSQQKVRDRRQRPSREEEEGRKWRRRGRPERSASQRGKVATACSTRLPGVCSSLQREVARCMQHVATAAYNTSLPNTCSMKLPGVGRQRPHTRARVGLRGVEERPFRLGVSREERIRAGPVLRRKEEDREDPDQHVEEEEGR